MKKFRLTAMIALLLAVLVLAACEKDDKQENASGDTTPAIVSGADVGPAPGLNIFGNISEEAKALCGSWSYNHEPEVPVLLLTDIGSAIYNDKMYNYDADATFISLTGTDGNVIKLRYEIDKDEILLYQTTVYTFDGEGTPDGLEGEWINKENNWSFEFTGGEFREDGYFPGHYTVNTENGSFKLMYNDHFEDTVCYYRIDGNKLIVEYPWRMVKTATPAADAQ